MDVQPFSGLRPAPTFVEQVVVTHRDSANEEYAILSAKNNPYSFLHISRAELGMAAKDRSDCRKVQERTEEALRKFQDEHILIRDQEKAFYIYRLTLGSHAQTGLLCLVNMKDYDRGHIKRHELTRDKKIAAQERILDKCRAHTEAVLLVFDVNQRPTPDLSSYVNKANLLYTFTDQEGIGQEVWAVTDPLHIRTLQEAFRCTDSFYIADGHHRIAAAAAYAKKHPAGDTEYMLAALFPSDEMKIFDYNRAVHTLGGLRGEEFLRALTEKNFSVETLGKKAVRPSRNGEFTMYLGKTWYKLTYTGKLSADPVSGLDVSILQDHVFHDILGIDDPQKDDRLSFISGTKGLAALEKAVQGPSDAAFAIPPVSMEEIMTVADSGRTMPPKSTCFEPKPISGIIIHTF